MELRDREEDEFTIFSKVNAVYLIELKVMTPKLAVWTDDGGCTEQTHEGLVEHLKGVVVTATVKGRKGTEAALMTWYQRLGRLSCKMVVELAVARLGWSLLTCL